MKKARPARRRQTARRLSARRPRESAATGTPAPVAASAGRLAGGLADACRRRVVIEGVAPEVNGGRFPIKRTPGERVDVTVHVHADGHDVLAAIVKSRYAGPALPVPAEDTAPPDGWTETPLTLVSNDEWTGGFPVDEIGVYEYTFEAWVDRFATWRRELRLKFEAGQDVASELVEGAELLHQAAGRAGRPAATAGARRSSSAVDLRAVASRIGGSGDQATRVAAALDDKVAKAVALAPDRDRSTRYRRVLRVVVNRERARFGAWYEMFPRSAGPDPTRSATFLEAATRLPEVAAMGFDVVYLPPIHPIGRSFRKGRNNTLVAEPGDPGSPWAIGSDEGGHTAVEPGLGTLDDFDRFVEAASHAGLEVALDLAYQCSPDHPYVREHPEWFRHRPDGTIKYAENPPKKYQDIYPFDFDTPAWRDLWDELKRVVLFWIGHGVKIFRVDNPHTKPYRFWEWLISGIRAEHPGVVFLSEAFTRPKIMRYLAKLGFDQSYTYFTWRNTKAELTEYFTELAQTDVREYLRPNLFANTPDILHAFLQRGGPPAFRIRLVLAATLGASYGIYSGFELCESRAVPGTEEYLNSEKYQYRQWDRTRPGHIVELVAQINRIRRQNPALHGDWSLRFHETDNPELLCYSKRSSDGTNVILAIVNLDPGLVQHGWMRVPIGGIGISPDESYVVHDLLDDARYSWRGEWNYVRLDPALAPAHIFRLTPAARGRS